MVSYNIIERGGAVMKKWTFSELNRDMVRKLCSLYGLPVFTAMLLTIRGITQREDIERFFAVGNELDSPMDIKDMDKAVERIRNAVVSYERICVYGDYDCDGITATAILYSYLESVCANVMYYIPDRNTEGYGMNIQAVDKLKSEGVSLIITVDNGISAIEETDHANSIGIDVVITDHHKPLDILPRAVAVVNPHRSDETCKFRNYCGAGIALKLITALEGDEFSIMENYSDLAAIGTVADVVPLEGENRDIVKAGIVNIENTERIGLSSLIEDAGVGNITSGAIGFRIGPRINAAGRLASPYDALELILSEDEERAKEKSELLCSLNSKRQEIEAKIIEKTDDILKNDPETANSRIPVIYSEEWNPGVIGIAASRISEKYGKPVILIAGNEEICRASGRSIAGFSIVDAVFACSEYLEKYGGHPMAVGFSIKRENIKPFVRAINDYANKLPYMPLAEIKLDASLNPETITVDMADMLKEFEPFGCGNPKPVFGITGAVLDKITPLKDGKHLRLSVSKGKSRLSLMYFFTTLQEFSYSEGDLLDFAVSLEKNEYQGKENISLIIKDVRYNKEIFDTEAAMYELQDYELYKSGVCKKEIRGKYPTRDDFKILYTFLKKDARERYRADVLAYSVGRFASKLSTPLKAPSIFKIMIILDIMQELHLADYRRTADVIYVHIPQAEGKVDLRASEIYRRLEEDIRNA